MKRQTGSPLLLRALQSYHYKLETTKGDTGAPGQSGGTGPAGRRGHRGPGGLVSRQGTTGHRIAATGHQQTGASDNTVVIVSNDTASPVYLPNTTKMVIVNVTQQAIVDVHIPAQTTTGDTIKFKLFAVNVNNLQIRPSAQSELIDNDAEFRSPLPTPCEFSLVKTHGSRWMFGY